MTDKQEYVEETVATPAGSTSDISGTIAENLHQSLDHETKEQAALDIEMAKARKSTQEPPSRRWIVLATATLGALFVSLQGSALIVALPDLMKHLNVSFADMCVRALFMSPFSLMLLTDPSTHFH